MISYQLIQNHHWAEFYKVNIYKAQVSYLIFSICFDSSERCLRKSLYIGRGLEPTTKLSRAYSCHSYMLMITFQFLSRFEHFLKTLIHFEGTNAGLTYWRITVRCRFTWDKWSLHVLRFFRPCEQVMSKSNRNQTKIDWKIGYPISYWLISTRKYHRVHLNLYLYYERIRFESTQVIKKRSKLLYKNNLQKYNLLLSKSLIQKNIRKQIWRKIR